MTLCKDCKHHSIISKWERDDRVTDHVCGALCGQSHPVVEGEITHLSCDLMRLTLCGWTEPKLFEPIPK